MTRHRSRIRKPLLGLGEDTASIVCESQCAMVARDYVGNTDTWNKKLQAGLLPAGCEQGPAACIGVVKQQCVEQNCCKVHKQVVDQNCGIAQMLAIGSKDLCEESLKNMQSAGCSTPSSATSALQAFQATTTGSSSTGIKTGVSKLPSTPGAAPCSSYIAQVQAAIGTTVDGKWGPASQTALNAKGGDFRAFAPGCADPVPYATPKSASSTSVTTLVAPNAVVPVSPVASPAASVPWDKVAMGVVAVGVVAAIYYAVRK